MVMATEARMLLMFSALSLDTERFRLSSDSKANNHLYIGPPQHNIRESNDDLLSLCVLSLCKLAVLHASGLDSRRHNKA